MNKNQREEQSLADETVKQLQSNPQSDKSGNQTAIVELGRLLRESSDTNLPEPNVDLRNNLISQLGTTDAVVSGDQRQTQSSLAPSWMNSKNLWRLGWATVATLLLTMGFMNWQQTSKTAMLVEDSVMSEISSARPAPSNEGLEISSRNGITTDTPAFISSDTSWQSEEVAARVAQNPAPVKLQSGDIPRGGQQPHPSGDKLRSLDSDFIDFDGEQVAGKSVAELKQLSSLPDSAKQKLVKIPVKSTTKFAGERRESLQRRNTLEVEIAGESLPALQKLRGGASRDYGLKAYASGEPGRGMGDMMGNDMGGMGGMDDMMELGEMDMRMSGGGVGGGIRDDGAIRLADRRRQEIAQRDGRSNEQLVRRYIRPNNQEQYTPIHENKFVPAVGGAAISTFSIDVDTASYSNMRRFLTNGQMPPRDSIRIEELVNYFNYDYPQPKRDMPFSINLELASCPWNIENKLLRVGLQGKDVHVDERPQSNIVFLLDVSGSMNSPDKLPLLKRGVQMMVERLNENDRVSIVTYAGNAGVVLEPTVGDQTKTIQLAIERLTPGGSTHGSAGITLAYELAQQNFIHNAVNKVILATDGDLNVGVTDDGALVELIKQKASEGVFLTVLGFGTGNLKDGKLEKLADNGNGIYAYIDGLREAHKVLVQQMSGALVTIAKDVKIQIEFNPAEVHSYRLLGYENRLLATADFDNDQKDAGEIGAGHSVTALYELVTTNKTKSDTVSVPKGLKYQTAVALADESNAVDPEKLSLSDAAQSGELATLALRYKQPDSNTSQKIELAIKNQEKSFTSASDDFRFATSVAGFGMLLRGSEHSGKATPVMIEEIATQSLGDDESGYRAEFVDLIRRVDQR